MTEKSAQAPPVSHPAWIPCPDCDEFWCRIHQCHTHEDDCKCPLIEEWDCDPYVTGGPAT